MKEYPCELVTLCGCKRTINIAGGRDVIVILPEIKRDDEYIYNRERVFEIVSFEDEKFTAFETETKIIKHNRFDADGNEY